MELWDFQSLATDSKLIIRKHTNEWGVGAYRKPPEVYSISTGIHFGSRKRIVSKNIFSVRVGARYHIGTNQSYSMRSKTFHNYDTIQSVQPVLALSLDSLYDATLNINYSYDQLLFETALFFTTSQNERISFSTGLWFAAGKSLNEKLIIEDEVKVSSRIHFPRTSGYNDIYFDDPEKSSYEKEEFSAPKTLSAGVYIPFGIEIGLGWRRNFLNHFRLMIEVQGGCSIENLASSKWTRGYWGSILTGIKFKM